MGRQFVSASSQKLSISQAVTGSSPPLTMCCWFIAPASGVASLVSQNNGSNTYHSLQYNFGTLYATTVNAVGGPAAGPSGTFSAGMWNHGCGVWSATNSRKVYLNGSKATDTTNKSISGLNATDVGGNALVGYTSAVMAEIAIWNVALLDAEVLLLSQGVLPYLVRPQSLAAYWPLREPGTVLEIDWTPWSPRRYDLTVTGATPADRPMFLWKYTQGLSKKNIIGMGVSSPIVRPIKLGNNKFVAAIGQTNGILGPFGSQQ